MSAIRAGAMLSLIGANSTPTWFLETGERYSGAMPLEEVRSLLDRASPPQERGSAK